MKKLDKIEMMEERYELLKEKMYECDIIDIVDEFESFIEEWKGDITGEDLQHLWNCLAEEHDISLVDITELFVLYMADIVEW